MLKTYDLYNTNYYLWDFCHFTEISWNKTFHETLLHGSTWPDFLINISTTFIPFPSWWLFYSAMKKSLFTLLLPSSTCTELMQIISVFSNTHYAFRCKWKLECAWLTPKNQLNLFSQIKQVHACMPAFPCLPYLMSSVDALLHT